MERRNATGVSTAAFLPSPPLPPHPSLKRGPRSRRLIISRALPACLLVVFLVFGLGHVVLTHLLGRSESRSPLLLTRQSPPPAGLREISPLPPLKGILVLGSHHTGTSIVTKLIMEMGANAGDDVVMLPGNKLKYFEHRQVVELNKRVLSQGHKPNSPKIGPTWVDYGFDYGYVSPTERDVFLRGIDDVVAKLHADTREKSSPAFVMKDPRLGVVLEPWLSKVREVSEAVCVVVSRNPFETSSRLAAKYNRGESAQLEVWQWMEIWEKAMAGAIETCLKLDIPIVFAQHQELMRNPLSFAAKLEMRLFGKVSKFITENDVSLALGGDFHPPALSEDIKDNTIWTRSMRNLWEALETEQVASGLSFASHSPFRKEAYVTIVTGRHKGFIAGALVLAHSIRQFDVHRTLVAMISPEVFQPQPGENEKESETNIASLLKALRLGGFEIHRVQKLEEPWFQHHPKCQEFTASQQVRWGRMFTKLQVYSLSQFDRVLYLDTDVMALRALDVYFSLPHPFYAERSPSHRGINAGIMLIQPNTTVLQELIRYAKENEPRVFWPGNSVGCTEQELLNRFWQGSQMRVKLNNTRHFDYLRDSFLMEEGREENRMEGARLAHCLTTKCLKPWEVNVNKLLPGKLYDEHAAQALCDRLMYLVWFDHYFSDSLQSARLVLNAESDQIVAALGEGNSWETIHNEMLFIRGPQDENLKRNWHTEEILKTLAQRRVALLPPK